MTIPPLVTVRHRADGGANTTEYDAGFVARRCNALGDLPCLHDHLAPAQEWKASA